VYVESMDLLKKTFEAVDFQRTLETHPLDPGVPFRLEDEDGKGVFVHVNDGSRHPTGVDFGLCLVTLEVVFRDGLVQMVHP